MRPLLCALVLAAMAMPIVVGMSKSAVQDAARTFVRAITTPAAHQVFAAAGWMS